MPETSKKENPKEILDSAFKDLVLCLGGIFALHWVEDEALWMISQSIEEIYFQTQERLERLEDSPRERESDEREESGGSWSGAHPAIENLLLKLKIFPKSWDS